MEKGDANMANMDRRQFIAIGASSGLLALPGCTGFPQLSLTDAVRRLLTLSSQNAFATLLQPEGFLDDQVARLSIPESLGGGATTGLVTLFLRSKPVQSRLLKQVNRAAEKGADIAAPIIADTIRNMSIEDAASIINGGDRAATTLLQNRLGSGLVQNMLPGIGQGLKLFDSEIINLVLSRVSNVNFTGITSNVAGQANEAIFKAIGAQEAAIRANPQSTNDPVLIAALSVL